MSTFERWAACGAMWLTGDADGPPLAVPTAAAARSTRSSAFGLDASVLAERAEMIGLRRGGSRSCGRASRLLRCRDNWIALTLARVDDVESLPALLEADVSLIPESGIGDDAPWVEVGKLLADRPAAEVIGRGQLLGVPVTLVDEGGALFQCAPRGLGTRVTEAPPPVVVDLTSLWAGPLTTSCLAMGGATVIKIEDSRRPDGARIGNQSFFDLLNAGKLSVALDFGSDSDLDLLHRLVDTADIVVTSARQRALRQLGLDPEVFLAGGEHRVWAAITAHGWDTDRVGFGDDVAAAAGLVVWHPDGAPRFAGDAIADPLGGAMTADAALRAWNAGGAWFVDASLVGAASAVRSEGRAVPATRSGGDWVIGETTVAEPSVRQPTGRAAPLGADNETVLAALR